jgi:hypothetical protein
VIEKLVLTAASDGVSTPSLREEQAWQTLK